MLTMQGGRRNIIIVTMLTDKAGVMSAPTCPETFTSQKHCDVCRVGVAQGHHDCTMFQLFCMQLTTDNATEEL